MHTTIKIVSDSAVHLPLADATVDLVVTSPPYPMIEMWDESFAAQDGRIGQALESGDGTSAFHLMHATLDRIWVELFRVLKPGGLACINIGDATRSLNGDFRLYSNHSRILTALLETGFITLPDILWRKPTNAPNKFMGSGMLPVGAYVTYEHEYILVVRKGPRRVFRTDAERQCRCRSAFFWEERNVWFSDVWTNMAGTTQQLHQNNSRHRSAAFPFELAYRLICMFSIQEDIVLDPFLGTGTTLTAAVAAGRHGVGVEYDEQFHQIAAALVQSSPEKASHVNATRFHQHLEFVAQRLRDVGPMKYSNVHYGFPVMTAQEQELLLPEVLEVQRVNQDEFLVAYADGLYLLGSGARAKTEGQSYPTRVSPQTNRPGRLSRRSQHPSQTNLSW